MEERMVAPLREAIAGVAVAYQSVDIPLQRIGAFPRLQAPRVLWIGPPQQWEQGETAQRILSMQQAMAEACQTLGFGREEKAFHPHLTIARIKERERSVGEVLGAVGVSELHAALDSMTVNSVVLMKSDLRPTGSVYSKLWEVPLMGS
jgi:2'-5' RNA ligase